jgi:broad specificity phosphatase PhoE
MATITMSVRRHTQPEKDPVTGKSLDKLAAEGVEQAKEIGAGLGNVHLLCYASETYRALETAAGIVHGAGTRLISIKRDDDLNGLGANLMPYLVDETGGKRQYSTIVDLVMVGAYLQTGDETFQESGQRVVRHLGNAFMYLPDEFPCSDVRTESISHGPVVDAAYLRLRELAGEPQVSSIADIGGPFMPGENFELVVEYDRDRNDQVVCASPVLRCRGEETTADNGTEHRCTLGNILQ